MTREQIETSRSHNPHRPTVSGRQRRHAFTNTMRQARTHMHVSAHLWSIVIHWQPLDSIGSILANTIARPRAILYGSLLSCVTALGMYVTAKYYGYTLSGAEPLVGFAVGWAAGIIIDYTRLLITGGKQK